MYLSAEDVAFIDSTTANEYGIDVLTLMERAGMSLIKHIKGDNILIVCGCGNNGGDGLVLGRHLINMGINTKIYILGDINRGSQCFKENYQRLVDINSSPLDINPHVDKFIEDCKNANIIVDCLYGVGLKGPVRCDGAKVINIINNSNSYIISVDIPSGMECNTGETHGCCVKANLTPTFVDKKIAFKYPNSLEYTGEIVVEDIGIPIEIINKIMP